jgi:hypothetical protein
LNPITENRYGLVRYVVLWALVTAAYWAAFASFATLPAAPAALGAAVFGVVSGFEGLILWSILKYGTIAGTPTAIPFRIGRLSRIVATGILFVAVAIGAECLAWYISTETLPTTFVRTIPARSMIVAAVYVCFVLWYSSAAPSDGGNARGETSGGGSGEASAQIEISSSTAGKATDEPPEILERVTVRGSGGRIEVIAIGDILCLQAEGDYVAIVTSAGRWLKEGTMKYFEEALPRDRFVRVHRSCIVAVGHLSRIETSGRDHTLILRGGSPVRISDTGYRLLKRTLGL